MDDQREPIGAGNARETPVADWGAGRARALMGDSARRFAGRSWRFQAAASRTDFGDY